MARLINADKLLTNAIAISNYKGQVAWSAVSTIDILTAPTVDAVEVVRCRDCKHYKPQKKSAHWENSANYCNRVVTIKVQPDDFCSYGERKGAKMDEEVSD